MRTLTRLIFAAMLLAESAHSQERWLWILVPNFENSGTRQIDEFGTKTATFIFLQLWGQLIQHPTPNPEHLDFGRAGVTWDNAALPPRSYEEAEALARLQKEDPVFIVWGQIDKWGDSVLIHPRLAIRTDGPFGPISQEAWKIGLHRGPNSRTISVPLPATRYDFSTVQLSADVINLLSTPGGLDLLDAPKATAVKIGEVGDYFTRTSQEGHYAHVQVLGLSRSGWLYIPPLSSTPTEFVDFTSGVFKVLRHDWKGALVHFEKTTALPSTPASVRADTVLLKALCLSKSGKTEAAISLLRNAKQLPAQSPRLNQYLAMAYLASFSDISEQKNSHADDLRSLIRANLASPNQFEPWWKDLYFLLDEQAKPRMERPQ